MGFAAGVNAGTSFMSKLQENERANRVEGRTQKKFEDEQADRAALDTAISKVPDFPTQPQYGLNTSTPVANAPPTSVAATGGDGVTPLPPAATALAGGLTPQGTGVPAAPAAGVPAPPAAGVPAPAAAVAQAGAAEGLSTTSPVTPPAAPPAAAPAVPEMSHDKKVAQAMFGVAKAKRDVNGMNAALEQYHTADRKEIVNDAAKMSDDDAWNYVHENVNKVGSLPMSIVKEGKGGYRVTAWSNDGGKGASALLDSAQVKKLVAADKMMKQGYGSEGLDLAGSVNKDLNAVIKDYNTETNQQVTTGNTATHYANTEAETAQHNRATEANAAANTAIARDRASQSKANDRLAGMDIVASNKDGYMLMNKKGEREFVKYPEGVTQADFVKKYMPQGDTAPKINSDGSATYQGKLYEKDPKTQKWKASEGFGPTKLDSAIEADLAAASKGGAPAAAPAAPASAIPPRPTAAAAPAVDTSSPVEQAGLRVDAARQAVAELRRHAPGLAKGNAAREQFAAQLEQAQQAVREAEMLYQQTLPANTGAAFAR